jgi:hypothetical protein
MGRQAAGQTDILESRSPFGEAWPCRRAEARQAEGDPMNDVVQIDLTDLLTQILDDTVQRFADVLTRPGDNVLVTQAGLYRTVGNLWEQKAEIADALSDLMQRRGGQKRTRPK